MLADESLREGRLQEALAQLQEQVRRNPADAKLRVFLFQLLAVLGQWERALIQLNVASELDASTLGMVAVYREALNCERLRMEVFAGKRTPVVFGEPAEWVALLVEALRLTAMGRDSESQTVRARAFEAAPATGGVLDGQRFEWIADADARLGPVLEIIVNGRYYWVPFDRIRRIAVEPPTDLRDLVWSPVAVTWTNGGEAAGLVPTRYPASEDSEDPRLRLARRTDWLQRGESLYIGLGQRMLATDAGEYPLLEVRAVDLGSDAQAASPATAADSSTGG